MNIIKIVKRRKIEPIWRENGKEHILTRTLTARKSEREKREIGIDIK